MTRMINLTVSENNLRLIAMSLELQSRLLCGQFGEIDNLFRLYSNRNYNSDVVDSKLRDLKKEIFGNTTNIGIYSQEAKGLALDGYEVYKQILHYFHKDSKHWSVHKDVPLVTVESNKVEIEEHQEDIFGKQFMAVVKDYNYGKPFKARIVANQVDGENKYQLLDTEVWTICTDNLDEVEGIE